MGKIFFISGINTGVGKTIFTGLAARFLRRRGVSVVTAKAVQTGCREVSEDLEIHRKLMGVPSLPGDREGWTAPEIFAFPASPHLAAKLENRTVDTGKIVRSVEKLAAMYDAVLVEGAGGLAVPLSEDVLTADLLKERGWPVILVTNGALGSISSTLLSLEALAGRGIRLAGIAYNFCANADPIIDRDTPELIGISMTRYGFEKNIVRMAEINPERPGDSPVPDFSVLFREVLS